MPGCIASRAPALRHAAPHLVTLLWISSRPAASQEARPHRITCPGMSARRPASPHGRQRRVTRLCVSSCTAASRHSALQFITQVRILAPVSAPQPAREHPGRRRCIASRGMCIRRRSSASHHAWLQLSMRHHISSRTAATRDAPRHVLTPFNISALDAAREDAALQTWSLICRFAAANDGMQRLLLPCTSACAK
jgi:hypothetical protein